MRSEGPPLRDASEMIWVGDIPEHWARLRGARDAIIVPEQRRNITYARLHDNTRRFVEVMRARGVQPGDRIGYLGRNSDLYFAALFGAIAGGFVLLPLNWRYAAPELAFILSDAGARIVVADEEFMPVLEAALGEDDASSIIMMPVEGAGSLREALETPPQEKAGGASAVVHDPDQICLQIYTSGTTGKPKGVLITHGALTWARHAETSSEDWAHWNKDDVILSPLPNFHSGGMSWMLIGLIRGLTCVLTASTSVPHLLDLIEAHGVTRTFIVPTVVRGILDHLKETGRTAPSIRTVTYGAAVMSEALLKEAIAVLGCEFGQYFGMTEATGTVTFLPAKDHDLERPHLLQSVGRPQCGMAVEIRSADGGVLPAGEAGEIWVRSPTLMAGYWRLPGASAAAVVDGWYRTGDGGRLDEEGYLYITDRIKDMIISGGENIYPAQVEEVLRQHPAVLEAAVVGAPDERWGERVEAYVELRPGAEVEPEALVAFAQDRLARYKCPRVVHLVAALPRTPMGKVQRVIVRDQAAGCAAQPVETSLEARAHG